MRNRDSEDGYQQILLDTMLAEAYTSLLLGDRNAEFGVRGGVRMIAGIDVIVLSRPRRTRC